MATPKSGTLRDGGAGLEPVPLPRSRSLPALRRAAATCHGCPLWQGATQTGFGAGSRQARVILIGEQPGDQEDQVGEPFIGPAGRLLDRALAAADVGRTKVYVTNAVKRFKWETRGPRRLHKKPSALEIAACRPWLLAEVGAVKPDLLLCLGVTAAQAVWGERINVTQERGKLKPTPWGPPALVTVHSAALLPIADREDAEREFAAYAKDLRKIHRTVAGGKQAEGAAS